ncbi:hypothetical protein F6X40_11055 [Paraburkholderia sp. UCT31]|uniref:hypothetical protein n=1 Tax=Paraburkholderia sp. UCT31 TaxID=2615209 RepID=UPI0016551682|nr:hypothetical protein [Paraburkholderia sp. UCT31]MBC8737341.1 hypothetical protein [Paraburkholderia sp. UCT31]
MHAVTQIRLSTATAPEGATKHAARTRIPVFEVVLVCLFATVVIVPMVWRWLPGLSRYNPGLALLAGGIALAGAAGLFLNSIKTRKLNNPCANAVWGVALACASALDVLSALEHLLR